MGISWGYGISAKGGQSVKEKKEETVVTDKSTEYSLKVKLKSADESIDAAVEKILEDVDGLNEVTLTFSGQKHDLEAYTKVIAKIVAKHGGQQLLDIHLGEEQTIQ